MANLPIVTIRASSLPGLFDCAHRWEGEHLLGMKKASNGKAVLGTAIHASTAKFDQSTLDNSGLTIEECKAAAVDAIYRPNEDVAWEEYTPQDAEKIALALTEEYCTTVAPTMDYVAVEVKCSKLILTDIGIALSGTTDRLYANKDAEIGILDLKSGKQAVSADGTVKTQGHAAQTGVYELMAQEASGIEINAPSVILGLNTGKTAVAQRIGTGTIVGGRELLIGDDESPGLLQMASKIIHSGVFTPNTKSMMCHKSYCARFENCKYRR